jgi:hypothetical protein
MYALVEDNEIKEIITKPKAMIIEDVQYPAKIFQLWSKAELNAIGIYEVVTDSSNKKDEQYYINTNEQFSYLNDEVTRSWGTATPRRLEDKNATDENGVEFDPVVVIKGLKSERKDTLKNQASALLSTTDWYVVKANEVEGYTVPENITNFRSDVRAKSNEMETQIDACTTVDELKTLYEYVNTGTEENPVYERPLAEFPKEVV